MKKLLLSIVAFALMAIPALSQKKAYYSSKMGENWYIQLQGGGSYTITEFHSKSSIDDVIAPHVALSLGKHFTPVFGARLGVGGWQSKNYYKVEEGIEGTYKVKYIQTNLDALVNLTNAFCGYKQDRVFNLYGIAGFGYFHGFKNSEYNLTTTNIIAPRVGFQADFRLSSIVSLNLEVAGNLLRDDFNGYVADKSYDGVVDAMLGLKFNLSKKGFKAAEGIDQSQLDELNKKINAQKASLNDKDNEIDRLKNELDNKPEYQVIVKETEKIKEETEVLMNAVVV